MSGEYQHVQVQLCIRSSDQLPPMPDGEPMYPDDVQEEATQVVRTALEAWYAARGKDLLKSEPLL